MNPGTGSIGMMLQRLETELNIQFIANPEESRCAKCNSLLVKKNRKQVQNLVPIGSLRNHDTFWLCTNPQCLQLYWQGRHWTRIQNTIQQLKSVR